MRPSRVRSLATRLSFVPIAIAVTFASAPAFADEATPEAIAQARDLGQQGQAALDAKNYVEAEKDFAAAQKLYSIAPTLTLGLARAQAQLGKFVEAQEGYKKVIRDWENKPSPPPAFQAALDAARAEVGPVSAHIATVTISVSGDAPSPKVTIDGVPVLNDTLGLKRPVNPGPHKVTATADGYKEADASFTVADAGVAEAKLAMEKDPNYVAAPIPGGDGSPAPAHTSTTKYIGYGALGLGAVGVIFGGITGIVAISKHSTVANECPGGTCSSDKQSDVDSYHTMATLSTVGFIVGGVAAAAGAVLILTAPKQESASATISPYVGLGTIGATGRF